MKQLNQFYTKKQKLALLSLFLILISASLLFIAKQGSKNTYTPTVEADSTQYQTDFINQIATEAKKLQKEKHLFASITIAQAILESDWGNSELASESNNLFGIKAQQQDQAISLPTDEYINGKRVTVKAPFKKYATIQASMADHMQFLKGESYYAVTTSQNYREAAEALQAGGYATDPNYAAKLIELIEQFNLNRFDN